MLYAKNWPLYFVPFLLLLGQVFGEERKEITISFPTDSHGWEGDFADYPVGQEKFYELAWGWGDLPIPYQSSSEKLTKGLYLSGNNHSDDLFMFVKFPLNSLAKNQLYSVQYNVAIESNVPEGQMGIGGSPGESVYFKVGASTEEPVKKAIQGFYHLNVDKGNQLQGGRNAVVIGDLANAAVLAQNPSFLPKILVQESPLYVKTDSAGRLWLFVGTDSGFEGPTKYYIARIQVTLSPALND